MLILTRRSNERIFIGDSIVLVVLSSENNRVKLGIEAPSDIQILREEIADEVTKLNVDANLRSYSDVEEVASAKTGTS